jgi:hypothetical protein
MQKFIYTTLALFVLVVFPRALYNGPPRAECLQMLGGNCIKLRIVHPPALRSSREAADGSLRA